MGKCKMVNSRPWAQIIEACNNRPANVSISAWLHEKGICKASYYYELAKIRNPSAKGPVNDRKRRWNPNASNRMPTENTKKRGGNTPAPSDFVDITDLVNNDMTDPGSMEHPACSSVPLEHCVVVETKPGSYSIESLGVRLGAVIEMEHCRIILFNPVRRESLETIKEVFHVC